jgi:hypothetical protein
MKRLLLVGCVVACSGTATPSTTTTGSGSSSTAEVTPPSSATTCDDVKPRVEQLYRVEAQSKEPKRVDEAVADNTTMAMNDCAKDPGKLVPCFATAATASQLEKQCLIPLDDEGTEGEALRK